MGSCLSRSPEPEFHTVRVVYLNGIVDEFDPPISVSTITGEPTKHFVCTPAQLVSGAKPMRAEAALEPGRIYLSLPFSVLQADMSPLDFADVARRLTALARTAGSDGRLSKSPARSSPLSGPSRSPRSVRGLSWKPILDPIREMSFGRRNESELHLNESGCES